MEIRGTDLLSLHQRPRAEFLGEERGLATRILVCCLCHEFLGEEGGLSLEMVLSNQGRVDGVQRRGEKGASNFVFFITILPLTSCVILCKAPTSFDH